MANDKTKQEKELTVEERLKTLYQLQTILSEVDRIKTIRGELPLEVQDLEDEVAGLQTRIQNYKNDIEKLDDDVKKQKRDIDEAKARIDKYTEQQNNVRNNTNIPNSKTTCATTANSTSLPRKSNMNTST